MKRKITTARGRILQRPSATGLAAATVLTASMGLALLPHDAARGQTSRYAQTNSRSQYVHRIALYDVNENKIDPDDENAAPYSPAITCGKCHEYDAITHGYHFNAAAQDAPHGRRGEPWIWTDNRTGTQVPLSYRGRPGSYKPDAVGISAWEFVLKFGRHMPGGGIGEPVLKDPDTKAGGAEAGRWRLAGELQVDCMFCHSNDRLFSPEVWADHVGAENFAWAPTAALGLAQIGGTVKGLADDFDPKAAKEGEPAGRGLPKTLYRADKFDAEKKVFFDIVGKPPNNACYYCHTVRQVGADAPPKWIHDEDVHLRAGLSCVDCHRNGIEHHTVRGFENEEHPTQQSVAALSCRGCHVGQPAEDGQPSPASGRFGAPKPAHKGLPPVHLDKMSCTSCHAGPLPQDQAAEVQTSMAHELGLPDKRHADMPPAVVLPVLLRDETGVLYPYRMMWPAFWGVLKEDRVAPLNPDKVHTALRRELRVRRNFRDEIAAVRLSGEDKVSALGQQRAAVAEEALSEQEKAKLDKLLQTKTTAAFQEKLAKALQTLSQGEIDGAPVYVSGGKAYRLDKAGKVELFENPATKPYYWALAHDVRPARQSLGSAGCIECHSKGAPIFFGTITAKGPAPDNAPVTSTMHELLGLDAELLAAWNISFSGRSAFKWSGFVAIGAVALLLLLLLLVGLVASPMVRPENSNQPPLVRWNLWEKLVHTVTILCIVALGASGFYSVLAQGAIEGWRLFAHMIGAGVFMVVLPLIAITWAGPARFFRGGQGAVEHAKGERFLGLGKFTFWLMLVAGVITAGTMLASMLPLFDTDTLRELIDVHRYSGLVLFAAALVHCCTVYAGRLRRR